MIIPFSNHKENNRHNEDDRRDIERRKARRHKWKETTLDDTIRYTGTTPESIMSLTESEDDGAFTSHRSKTVRKYDIPPESLYSTPGSSRQIVPVYVKRREELGDFETDALKALQRWSNDAVRVLRVYDPINRTVLPQLASESEEQAYNDSEIQNAIDERKNKVIFFRQ